MPVVENAQLLQGSGDAAGGRRMLTRGETLLAGSYGALMGAVEQPGRVTLRWSVTLEEKRRSRGAGGGSAWKPRTT